tara:strand:- start:962 stop:1213 length:252 start_codon:yes stop_codon:yes gene_type:complete
MTMDMQTHIPPRRQPSQPRVMTLRRASEILAVAIPTLRAWITAGKLGYVRLGTRSIRIPVDEIDRLIDEGRVPAIRALGAKGQ